MSTVKEDIVSVDTNNQVDNSWLASSIDGDYFNEQRMSIPKKPTEEVLTQKAETPTYQNKNFDMIKGIFTEADLNQQMIMVQNKNEKVFAMKKSSKSIPNKYLIESNEQSSREEPTKTRSKKSSVVYKKSIYSNKSMKKSI